MKKIDTFVLMPFGANGEYTGGPTESNFVFNEIIEPAVREAVDQLNREAGEEGSEGVVAKITREVDRNKSGSITASIVRGIAKSEVVIVDITGRNPNVFLELGIRYALRNKVTVLLAQTGTKIPFDIKLYRYIEYNHFKPAEARSRIAEAIGEGLSGSLVSDSVVFDVLPALAVTLPGIVESRGVDATSARNVMSWEEYMKRIESTCAYLESALREFRYLPDAILGVTNGGLIAADLIGKRVYAASDRPVLSLWALRHAVSGNTAFWYFDNTYNDATLEAVRKAAAERRTESEGLSVLVIDDHMGTGSTARQAIAYIKDRLGESARICYIPIVSRRLDNVGVVEDFLPYSVHDEKGPIFDVSREGFLEALETKALYFPYFAKQVNVSTSG